MIFFHGDVSCFVPGSVLEEELRVTETFAITLAVINHNIKIDIVCIWWKIDFEAAFPGAMLQITRRIRRCKSPRFPPDYGAWATHAG